MPLTEASPDSNDETRGATRLRALLLTGGLVLALLALGCQSGPDRSWTGGDAPDRSPVQKGPDGIWPALPESAGPVFGDLATQVPGGEPGFVSPELRDQLEEIYARFTLALDTTCSADRMADSFSRNGRLHSPIEGADLTGRENIRAAMHGLVESLGGEQACHQRWISEPATRRHHLALAPVFVRLGPEYVRMYSKTVVLGPDPDGLHVDQGHAIRVLRLYVHDFVYEEGAWKFHLYFDE